MRTRLAVTLMTLVCAGCYAGKHSQDSLGGGQSPADGGDDADADGADDGADDGVDPPDNEADVAMVGLRRLTSAEYDATLRDILLDEHSNSELLLPVDPRTPFDNDYTTQIPSETLIEATELLATDAADRLLDDPVRLASLLPCTPTGPDDVDCLQTFAEQFGRRALRRPLVPEEVQTLLYGDPSLGGAAQFAADGDDFGVGVHTIVAALLQAPEFMYRVEIGNPVAGDDTLFKLDDFEMATRLSYLLWGSAPDDWMLDRADDGRLSTPHEVRDVADQMLDDPRALDRVDRFHAMWLSYETLPFGGELADAMKAETRALIQRVIFERDAPWQDVFRSQETFVTDGLARHYGIQEPDAPGGGWVSYGDVDRQGLLSHGTFLSNGGKFGDTSPVQRGLMVRTRVFCQDIPPPPPGVDADEAPVGGICKQQRYAAHSEGGCASCHEQIDPIGFGLENYGPLGAYREFEVDNPETPEDETTCAIPGDGELLGVGTFNGPAQLADLALDAGYLNACVQQQLYRFIVGRYALDGSDVTYLQGVREQLGDDDFTFRSLLLTFVGSNSFGYRREAPAQP